VAKLRRDYPPDVVLPALLPLSVWQQFSNKNYLR
jgi:hypothetical protein